MVTYLSRDASGLRPPRSGPGELTASRVTGVVIHWPGTSTRTPITTQTAVAAALRGWQAFHMDPEPNGRGWSDIAYQVAVDQAGRAWMLRGFRNQSAANGNEELNKRYGAILLVLVEGEDPSTAMKATVRELVGHFRKIYPGATAVLPHSAVRPDGTDCPGPAARAALEAGDFTPGTPPTEDDDMWNAEQAEKIEKRYTLAHQLWLSQTYAERAVSDALAVKLLNGDPPPSTAAIVDAVKTIELLWRPIQRVQAEALEKLT